MKPLLKRILQLFLALSSVALAIIGYMFYDYYYNTRITYEFYVKLGQSNQSTLDLSKFNSLEWDELALVTPDNNICDLQINEYEKNSSQCKTVPDRTESLLLFLNNNKVVHEIKLSRHRLDLVNSKIEWRVKKSDAVFIFQKTGSSPTVKLSKDLDAGPHEIDVGEFNDINVPILISYLHSLKKNEITKGIELSNQTHILQDYIYLGRNASFGAFIFKKNGSTLAIVTKSGIDLPSCGTFENENTEISGEIYTYKKSIEYPAFIKCPKEEWLQDLK